MLVHDEETGPFAYKQSYVARIKHAFERMLVRATGART
jgi:hypothetical protein